MTRYYAVMLMMISIFTTTACKKKTTCENNIIETNFSGIGFYNPDSARIQPTLTSSGRIAALSSKYDSLYGAHWVCGTRRYNNAVLVSGLKIYSNKDIVLPDITIPAKSNITGYTSNYFSCRIITLPDQANLFYTAELFITKQLPNKELKEGLYTFFADAQSVNGNQYKDSTSVYLRY